MPKYKSAEKGGKTWELFTRIFKEREITDAYYQRKSLQSWRQYVCNCKLNNYFAAKTSKLQIFSLKILKSYLRLQTIAV